jgi:CheY-like chemotaxis protein
MGTANDLRERRYNAGAMKKRILSISYDEPLLVTRKMLLEEAGYEVISAFGFVAAMEICISRHDFDVVLMGHSMPQKDETLDCGAARKMPRTAAVHTQTG